MLAVLANNGNGTSVALVYKSKQSKENFKTFAVYIDKTMTVLVLTRLALLEPFLKLIYKVFWISKKSALAVKKFF